MSDWTDLPLGELATIRKGVKVDVFETELPGTAPYLGASSLEGEGAPTKWGSVRGGVTANESDVLMLWDGERSGLTGGNLHGVVASTVARLAPKERVSSDFLRHALQAKYGWIQSRRTGTGVPHVPKDLAAWLLIRVPPTVEQRRIAEILDALDDQIRASGQLLEKLQSIEQGTIASLLAPIRHAARVGGAIHASGLPAGWRAGRLDEFCTLQRGFDITQNQQRPGPYPVISSSGVNSLHDRFMVAGPGVITGRKGSLGKVYYCATDFWPHDTSLWVKDFHGNEPKFIALLLRYLRLERHDAATSVPTLNRNNIHPLPVAVPSLSEQRLIVSRSEAFVLRARAEEACLEKLRAIKSGLLDDLLTGRVRVPAELLS